MSDGGLFTIRVLDRFDPPGSPYVDDGLSEADKLAWSKQISAWMDTEINAKDENGDPLAGGGGVLRTPLTQFFNGTVTAFDVDQDPVAITWIGFPNLVKTKYPTEPRRWKEADSTKNNQDEYLEWSLKRNSKGNIETVTFTCEGPEYWEFLARQNPSIVDTFYKQMNPDFANDIHHKDLWKQIPGGEQYNAQNKWNAIDATETGTIAHLVQPNNTLSAEVDIAAQGTVIRKDKDGKIITDKTKLINCSRYGQPARNSDPTIGDAINTLARKGTALSIANPVAIYMHHFNTSNFQLDIEGTGDNMVDIPAGTFRWQRGNIAKNMGLRLQVKIPDGVVGTGPDNKGVQMTVSDIVDTSNNNNILYGAQFADYITMTVKGVALSGGKPAEPVACPCPPPKTGHANALAAKMVDRERPRKVVHLGRY